MPDITPVIKDLLDPRNDNLQVRESTGRGIFVGNLSDEVVDSLDAVQNLLDIGQGNRHTGETNMNEKSSRSHTICRLV
jgi:centromeric protein E